MREVHTFTGDHASEVPAVIYVWDRGEVRDDTALQASALLTSCRSLTRITYQPLLRSSSSTTLKSFLPSGSKMRANPSRIQTMRRIWTSLPPRTGSNTSMVNAVDECLHRAAEASLTRTTRVRYPSEYFPFTPPDESQMCQACHALSMR